MKNLDTSCNLKGEGYNRKWENVLLTDAGFYFPANILNVDIFSAAPILRQNARPLNLSIERFAKMLDQPFCNARVLFIPTAAQDDESRFIANFSRDSLYWLGILPENLTIYDIDGSLTAEEAMTFDAVYFTGGWDEYLLNRIKQTGFDKVVMEMVYSNKVYIGQSAGTVLATPNIRGCFGGANEEKFTGLGLINAFIDCHCDMKPQLKRLDLPLPHIMLHFNQAIAVSSDGYEIIDN